MATSKQTGIHTDACLQCSPASVHGARSGLLQSQSLIYMEHYKQSWNFQSCTNRNQKPSVHMLSWWHSSRQQAPKKDKTEEKITQRVQKTGGLLFSKNVCQTLPINREGRSDIHLHSHKPLTWIGRVQVPPTASVCPQGDPGEICTGSDTGENHGLYIIICLDLNVCA